jgi:hypothetical protein
VTYALETELLEPTPAEVWTEFANPAGAHAPYLAVLGCGSVGFLRIKGWITGATTGDINGMSVTGQTALGAGLAEQALETELSTSASFTSPVGPDPSTMTTTEHVKSASPTEIKT